MNLLVLVQCQRLEVAGSYAERRMIPADVVQVMARWWWPVRQCPGHTVSRDVIEATVSLGSMARPQPAATEPSEVRPALVDLRPEGDRIES